GTTETVTFTPDEGYEIDKVTVNGVEVAVVGNTLTLVMDENKDVVVSYKKMPITTRWVDEDNNDLKAPVTALEAQPAGTIEGYSFVETITEGTNVTHCFEKIVIPDTGDNYPIQLLISIAMVSLAGVVIVSKRKKSYGMKA
ncbi:MAG TPA: LPXTG cell wall anchor domain-containing protein, partial [Erysipelotrichaceae bacterium]|nr:LPXTG cell wall anchor domain-containing protein [Erysipelotrichaceae bacterium]